MAVMGPDVRRSAGLGMLCAQPDQILLQVLRGLQAV